MNKLPSPVAFTKFDVDPALTPHPFVTSFVEDLNNVGYEIYNETAYKPANALSNDRPASASSNENIYVLYARKKMKLKLINLYHEVMIVFKTVFNGDNRITYPDKLYFTSTDVFDLPSTIYITEIHNDIFDSREAVYVSSRNEAVPSWHDLIKGTPYDFTIRFRLSTKGRDFYLGWLNSSAWNVISQFRSMPTGGRGAHARHSRPTWTCTGERVVCKDGRTRVAYSNGRGGVRVRRRTFDKALVKHKYTYKYTYVVP